MEIPWPIDVDGVSVARDLSTGRFRVEAFGSSLELRTWTYGERRRLLGACVRSSGFDDTAFVDAFTRLVYTPPPPSQWVWLFAYVALSLFEVEPGTAMPQAEADARLARELGVLPSHSDGESATELDRMVLAFGRPMSARGSERRSSAVKVAAGADVDRATGVAEDGWTRIVVVEDDDE